MYTKETYEIIEKLDKEFAERLGDRLYKRRRYIVTSAFITLILFRWQIIELFKPQIIDILDSIQLWLNTLR